MDVELQILKHLLRDAHPTVAVIYEYCAEYKDLFKEVRNYECFKHLHLGITLPVKKNTQRVSLHHFIENLEQSADELRSRRLNKINRALDGETIILVIDKTGDRKKDKQTNYVAKQYL